MRRVGVRPGTAWVMTMLPLGASGVEVSAQSSEAGRSGHRETLDPAWETALALSAAPAAVTEDATVLVWADGHFEKAREGGNGVTCYVARSWPDSLEPHCFDAEGSATILPIHLRQMEMWHEGASGDEIDAMIAEGLRTGEFRLPARGWESHRRVLRGWHRRLRCGRGVGGRSSPRRIRWVGRGGTCRA